MTQENIDQIRNNQFLELLKSENVLQRLAALEIKTGITPEPVIPPAVEPVAATPSEPIVSPEPTVEQPQTIDPSSPVQ